MADTPAPDNPLPTPGPATREVRILGTGTVFRAGQGHTVLQAAQLGGVKLPSSCRNGTCRACRCRCLAGEVSYRIEWPGLSAEEKRDRWILPCVAHAESDLVLEFGGE